ncbi:hypothetical protein GWI33_001755 [Rhynchophorus ferrugineus]|uniref:Uncharacterized protein n=1 Tax=Rhynchophorus ferrugineus TaxID=354439 RepID=A0A834MJY3_RHYFE|nr:hypothetical protein GWI33_001755 [Rhynchophorus ferrugineus]
MNGQAPKCSSKAKTNAIFLSLSKIYVGKTSTVKLSAGEGEEGGGTRTRRKNLDFASNNINHKLAGNKKRFTDIGACVTGQWHLNGVENHQEQVSLKYVNSWSTWRRLALRKNPPDILSFAEAKPKRRMFGRAIMLQNKRRIRQEMCKVYLVNGRT